LEREQSDRRYKVSLPFTSLVLLLNNSSI